MVARLTLFGRTYCRLCDEMLEAVVNAEPAVTVEVVDVDADESLEARFGEKVPVLYLGEREICHYVLDRQKLREALSEVR